MKKKNAGLINDYSLYYKLSRKFHNLSYQIWHYANKGIPRIDFLCSICKILIGFSKCDEVELHLTDKKVSHRWCLKCNEDQSLNFQLIPYQKNNKKAINIDNDSSDLERLCSYICNNDFIPFPPFFTKKGSFWIGNTDKPIIFNLNNENGFFECFNLKGDYKSMLLIPFLMDNANKGILQLNSKQKNYFKEEKISFYEDIAQTIGIALVNQSVHAELRERIKELTCLYGIAKLVGDPPVPIETILYNIAKLLPPAMQYPEISGGRIILDENYYSIPSDFQENWSKLGSPIIVNGKKRGFVEVAYVEKKPASDIGPFLKEEKKLIDTIARQVALIIEQKQIEKEKTILQKQLLHADRLATIGQLSAGVAHELNEPLGTILGFAQLAKKNPDLPEQAKHDMEKIVDASLHAREIVKKLLIFARQMPTKKTKINLNNIINNGLYFITSRCSKEGIELICLLEQNLPEIIGDTGQLYQILVNLVVNAIQSMPKGGKLTIQTLKHKNYISFSIEDTGIGMSEEVKKHIFIPFFTTKEVGQGTGLGLSVVHGIVSLHGGTIKFDSEVDKGTRFEIQFPISGNKKFRGEQTR